MTPLRTLLLYVAIFLLFAPLAHGTEILTNDTIVSMVKAGLGEEVIISKITTSTGQYDTSAAALVNLKSAGVSDKIIQAMMGVPTGTGPAPAAGAPQVAPPALPSTAPVPSGAPTIPTVPGMVVVQGQSLFVKVNDRVLEVVPVVPELAHSMKKHFIPFYFGPGDNWHFVRGQKAVVRLPKGKPSFYTKVNPSSFQLMRLTYDAERNFRYVVSTGSTYRGGLPFTTNRLSDDTFELTPSAELEPGEYAFIAGGSFYDFGIE